MDDIKFDELELLITIIQSPLRQPPAKLREAGQRAMFRSLRRPSVPETPTCLRFTVSTSEADWLQHLGDFVILSAVIVIPSF